MARKTSRLHIFLASTGFLLSYWRRMVRFAEVWLKIKSMSDLSEAPGQGVIFALMCKLAHLRVPQLDCDLSVGKGGGEGVV